MKIVAFVGSPRVGGNTDILIDEVIKGAVEKDADVSKFYLNDLNINPCVACGTCGENIDCKIDDDCNILLNEILDADAIIFGTPIYYGQMTAQAKIFTDRFYSISRNPLKSYDNKKAILIFTHGAPIGTYDQYIELTKNSPFGHLGFDVVDTIAVGGLQEIGDVKNNSEVMEEVYKMGGSL